MQIEMIEPVAAQDPPFDVDGTDVEHIELTNASFPAAANDVPMVVLAQAGDPPASEVAEELVDRAEIAGGQALIQLSKSEQLVAQLRAAHAAMNYSMATTKEAKETRAFRARCVELRTTVAARCLMLRRPAIDFGKNVMAAERPLIAEIVAIEKFSDDIIKADEKRREDERKKAAEEAAERKKMIDEAIDEVRSRVEACINQPAAFIAETIAWIDNTEITEEDYGDRAGEALAMKVGTRAKLVTMQEAAVAQEQAAADQKKRDDALEEQRLELVRREAAITHRENVGKRIDEIRKLSALHVESDSATLAQAISTLALDAEWFGERYDEAAALAATAMHELQDLHAAALDEEAAEADAQALALAEAPPPAPPAPPPPTVAAPTPEPEPERAAPPPATAPVSRGTFTRQRPTRPTDDALIGALALHYRVHESTVIGWLLDIDLTAASARLAKAADEGLPF